MASPNPDTYLDELKRNYRVIDMMLTMHCILRDRKKNFAMFVDLLLLAVSVVMCATVFIDPATLTALHMNPEVVRIVRGLCSIAVFLISVVSLRVDWKQQGQRHSEAAEILSQLKADCRDLLKAREPPSPEVVIDQCRRYANARSTLPKIPEAKFLGLKARHFRKIELSRLIDTYPAWPVFMIRLTLQTRTLKRAFRRQGVSKGEE